MSDVEDGLYYVTKKSDQLLSWFLIRHLIEEFNTWWNNVFWVPLPQPPKSLSSTQKTPRFHTQLSCTSKTFSSTHSSVPTQKPISSTHWTGDELRVVWNWGVLVLNWGVFDVELRSFWCGTEGGETKVFWCWNEGFWVLKRCGPCVEPMCWTERVCVELRGTMFFLNKSTNLYQVKFYVWPLTGKWDSLLSDTENVQFKSRSRSSSFIVICEIWIFSRLIFVPYGSIWIHSC